VGLRGCFSNPQKPVKTLISRVLRGLKPQRPPAQRARDVHSGAPVVENSRQAQPRLNASNRTELLEGYASGIPIDEFAERFRVHRGTVRAVAKRVGLAARQPELELNTRREAARLYTSGLALSQVAKHLGIGDEAVRAAVVARGGTARRRGRPAPAARATNNADAVHSSRPHCPGRPGRPV
jgi:hypothetical protein